MNDSFVKDLELVLIDYFHPNANILIHQVGWVLNEDKKHVLLTSELHEDYGIEGDDENNEGFGVIRKIKKRSIKYRRPIDQAVNLDVNVLPFTFAELDEYISMTYAHNEEHCMDSMRKVAEWVTWKFTGKSNLLRRPLLTKEQEDVIISKLEKPASKIDRLADKTVSEVVETPGVEGDIIEDDETKWWVGMTPRCVWGVDINPNLREVIKAFKRPGSPTIYLVYDNWTVMRVPDKPKERG